jgi:transcriptional regulator with XRE-family HTH domain
MSRPRSAIEIDGEALRALRLGRGLSPEQLAVAIGHHSASIYKWESGSNVPQGRAIAALCEFFDVPPGDFVRTTDWGHLYAAIESGDVEEAAALAREMAEGNGVEVIGTGGVRLPADVAEALRGSAAPVWPARGRPAPEPAEPARPARRMTGRERRQRGYRGSA